MMKYRSLSLWISTLAFSLAMPLAAHETGEAHTHDDKPVDISKVSEAFGNFIGRTLNNPSLGIKFDIEAVIKGIREGSEGKPSPMSERDYEEAVVILQEQGIKKLAEENLAKANDFLAKNAKNSGIIEIEPGKLQYEIIQKGDGPKVAEHTSPLIQYTGKFIDGTVFGSSEESGPIRINLDRTITGFSKGLIGMEKGEKRRLFIHPDLAYGTKGDLAPNALLIFEVEVVNVGEPEQVNAAAPKIETETK